MVNHRGAARRNDRNVTTTAMSSPSMVALILVVFLGACLSLSESSPTGLDHGGADAAIFDPKRSGARGFHEGIFDDGFGSFATYKKRNMLFNSNGQRVMKRRPEMDSKGIHGDAFTGGFGDFYTMKRSQQIRPESFLESLRGGYEELLNRVAALERKNM